MPNKSTQTDSSAKESTKPSALTKFHLAFEYDRTWSEAKQTIQHRPSKK